MNQANGGQQHIRVDDVTRGRWHHALLQPDGQETGQQCPPRHGLTSLMVKAPKDITLLIGTIIFCHDDIPLKVHLHPFKNISISNSAMGCFRSILHIWEQVTPPVLQATGTTLVATMDTGSNVQMAH